MNTYTMHRIETKVVEVKVRAETEEDAVQMLASGLGEVVRTLPVACDAWVTYPPCEAEELVAEHRDEMRRRDIIVEEYDYAEAQVLAAASDWVVS